MTIRLSCETVALDFVDVPHGSGAGITATYAVGSAHDPVNCSGLAHFVEHLMFKAGGKKHTSRLLANIDQLNGDVNAFTSRDMTMYHISIGRGTPGKIKSALQKAVHIIATFAFCLEVTDSELKAERRVVIEELHRRQLIIKDQQGAAASILYQGTPYANSVSGQHTDLNRITLSDVHAFFKKHYRVCWLVLACPHNMRNMIRRILDKTLHGVQVLPAASMFAQLQTPMPLPSQRMTKQWRVVQWAEPIVQYAIAFRGNGAQHMNEAIAMSFVAHAARTGFTSPLFVKMREQGSWVYSIQTSSAQHRKIGYTCFSFSTTHLSDAEPLRVCIDTLTRFCNKRFCEKMIERHKEKYLELLRSGLFNPLARARTRGFYLAAGVPNGNVQTVMRLAVKTLHSAKYISDVWSNAMLNGNVAVAVFAPRGAVQRLTELVPRELARCLRSP